jgi:hypothetical protein
MRAVTVVVALEIKELQLQIGGRPEQRAVQVTHATILPRRHNAKMVVI